MNHELDNQEKPAPPQSVLPDTWYFLLDVVENKTYESIDAERRNMIGIYYGSNASVRDLQKMYGYTSFSSIKYRIQTGMVRLWEALPEDVKSNYNPNVVGTMKTGMSDATRKRMSDARKQRWDNDQEYRDAIVGHTQARWDQYKLDNPPVPKEPKPPRVKKPKKPTIPVGSPEDRARKSANAKALWADPEKSARMREAAKNRAPSETRSASLKAVWQDPDYRAEMSLIRRETWEDPDHRENMTVGIQRGTRKPEVRAKRSDISKKTWANSDFREKMIRIHQMVYERDNMGEKMKAGREALMTDPEYRERIREIRRKIWIANNMTERMAYLREHEFVAEDTNYRRDESVIELWMYASTSGLTEQMVAQGFLSQDEVNVLENFFSRKRKAVAPDEMLVDRFSVAVARLV